MDLKFGVAGLGHGRTLLQANTPLGSHLPLRVTAVCDSDGARAQEAAERYEVPFVTTDFDELVARPELDVIGIYTPGPLHAAQILAAIDAGKHVMVTKSMVYTMEQVEQVVAAVDRSGRVLLVTQSMRARLDFMEAKRACDAGEIGELYLAESHYIHDLRPVYDYSPWRRCTATGSAAGWRPITPRRTTSSSTCASPAAGSDASPPSSAWWNRPRWR